MMVVCDNVACKYNSNRFCKRESVLALNARGQCIIWNNNRRIPLYTDNDIVKKEEEPTK